MIDYDLFKQVFNSNVDVPKESVKEEDANPYEVRDLSDRQKDVRLFLTNIRTFQQFATDKILTGFEHPPNFGLTNLRSQHFYLVKVSHTRHEICT